MPKVKQYDQKFRKEWLQDQLLKDWIMVVPGDDTRAHCKYCKTELKAKYQDLKNHAQCKKHINTSLLKNYTHLSSIFTPPKHK